MCDPHRSAELTAKWLSLSVLLLPNNTEGGYIKKQRQKVQGTKTGCVEAARHRCTVRHWEFPSHKPSVCRQLVCEVARGTNLQFEVRVKACKRASAIISAVIIGGWLFLTCNRPHIIAHTCLNNMFSRSRIILYLGQSFSLTVVFILLTIFAHFDFLHSAAYTKVKLLFRANFYLIKSYNQVETMMKY